MKRVRKEKNKIEKEIMLQVEEVLYSDRNSKNNSTSKKIE